jgi:ABC-2 type transport system permease protein
MAVYKKTYRGYDGPVTASWSRFLVIPRYAFEDLRRSRFLTLFFIGSFLFPLIWTLIVYVQHNVSALRVLQVDAVSKLISINSAFFMNLLGTQSMLAFFLAAFIGPGQVSPDLTNNALSLYLARPFSRLEYVLGKASILLILLSLMTWVPGLMLFGLQGSLEGWDWMTANSRIAGGMFLGAWVWILVLTMLALALSAWVKWKPAAGALMFGTFFVAAGFGAAVNGMQRTKWGHLLNISHLVGSVWVDMFDGKVEGGKGAVFFRVAQGEEIPLWCCWASLGVLCLICTYMLWRKIRGAEVVR